jgi:hypothetical protein
MYLKGYPSVLLPLAVAQSLQRFWCAAPQASDNLPAALLHLIP